MRASRSDDQVSRLVAFTDGVVAIAITLVALPLVDSARGWKGSAAEYLSANTFGLVAATLSFLVIGSFWKDHHRLYAHAGRSTALLVNINLVWLAAIVFLPLPTVLVVNSPGHDRFATGMYIGSILVAEVSIRAQELVIVRSGLLREDSPLPVQFLWEDWIIVGLCAISLVVGVAVPDVGLYSLALLLLARPARWLFHRRRAIPTPAERIF